MAIAALTPPSLNDIIKHNIHARFRRFYPPTSIERRDLIIGLVGERGSGKDIGGVDIALRDYMMNGDPCWSNMEINVNFRVSDSRAQMYGREKGGVVPYKSQYLDKQEFLSLGGQYINGLLYFSEFNIDFGEARRSGSNTNLRTSNGVQQLRHLNCGLVYNLINEMYADTRIRENTDIFIKCKDVAYKPANLRQRMEPGHVFEWEVYFMTARLVGYGNTYADTHTPIGPIPVTLDDLWEGYSTFEMQGAGKTTYSDKTTKQPILTMKESENVTKTLADPLFTQIEKSLDKFWDNHKDDGEKITITSGALREELGISKGDWSTIFRDYVNKYFLHLEPDDCFGNGSIKSPIGYRIKNRILV